MPTLAELLSGIPQPYTGPSFQPVPAELIPLPPQNLPIGQNLPPPASEDALAAELLEQENARLLQRFGSNIVPYAVNSGEYWMEPFVANAPVQEAGPGGQQLAPVPQTMSSIVAPTVPAQAMQGSPAAVAPVRPADIPLERLSALAAPQPSTGTLVTYTDVVAPRKAEPPPAARPPANEQEAAQRTGLWKRILTKLDDPDTFAALQTFFATLSAPMAPWETGWTRLGKASQMFNLHKAMLEENRKLEAVDAVKREDDLEKAYYSLETTRRNRVFDKDMYPYRVRKAIADYERALLLRDQTALENTKKRLENALLEEFGYDRAKAEIEQIEANAQRLRSQPSDSVELAAAAQEDRVAARALDQAEASVRGVVDLYKTSAQNPSRKDFDTWVSQAMMAGLVPENFYANRSLVMMKRGKDPLENLFPPSAEPIDAGVIRKQQIDEWKRRQQPRSQQNATPQRSDTTARQQRDEEIANARDAMDSATERLKDALRSGDKAAEAKARADFAAAQARFKALTTQK